MSWLSSRQIAFMVMTENLIEPGGTPAFWNESERGTWGDNWRKRLESIEGNAFDFRLKAVMEPDESAGIPYLGETERMIPPGRTVEHTVPDDPSSPWYLKPWKSYLLQTQESVNIPVNMGIVLDSRTSVFRSFCGLFFGPVHPGYSGALTIECVVFHPKGFLIDPLARVITGRFIRFSDAFGSQAYTGIWSGDCWTTEGNVVRAF